MILNLSRITVRQGATRIVFLIGNCAIKVPQIKSWRLFLNGLLGNMQERQFSATQWAELCPVLISDPLGFALIMQRAEPLTDEEWKAFDYQGFVSKPDYCVPTENKRCSFGVLNGEIVAIDYGS